MNEQSDDNLDSKVNGGAICSDDQAMLDDALRQSEEYLSSSLKQEESRRRQEAIRTDER